MSSRTPRRRVGSRRRARGRRAGRCDRDPRPARRARAGGVARGDRAGAGASRAPGAAVRRAAGRAQGSRAAAAAEHAGAPGGRPRLARARCWPRTARWFASARAATGCWPPAPTGAGPARSRERLADAVGGRRSRRAASDAHRDRGLPGRRPSRGRPGRARGCRPDRRARPRAQLAGDAAPPAMGAVSAPAGSPRVGTLGALPTTRVPIRTVSETPSAAAAPAVRSHSAMWL